MGKEKTSKHSFAITVCILAYNRPEGLKNTVQSFLNQGYEELTILIGDDASPNPEVQRVGQELAQEHPEVNYQRNASNLGIVGNHRALLQKVTTPYMAWACDDDRWSNDYLVSCMQAFKDHPQIVWAGSLSLMHDGFRPIDFTGFNEYVHTLGETKPLNRFRMVFPEILYWNNSFYGVFKTEIAQKLPLKKRFAFDYYFTLKAAALGEFYQIPKTLFFKKIGGVGTQLNSNLKAIGLNPKRVKYPSLELIRHLWAFLWLEVPGNFFAKLRASLAVLAYLLNNSPFAGRRDLHYFLRASHTFTQKVLYKLSEVWMPWSLIKSFEFDLLKQIRGRNQSDGYYLEIKKLGVSLKAQPENYNIIFYLDNLIQLQGLLNLYYSAAPDFGLIAHFANLHLQVKNHVDALVIEEVFLREVYGVSLEENSVVIDVGMNIGFTSLYFARQEKVHAIHAFEPLGLAQQQAEENFALNPGLSSKVKRWPFGLSDKNVTFETKLKSSLMATFNASTKETYQGPTYEHLSKSNGHQKSKVNLRDWREVLPQILEQHKESSLILKLDCEGCENTLMPQWLESGILKKFQSILMEWHGAPQAHQDILRRAGFHLVTTQNKEIEYFENTGMIYAHRKS